MKYVDYEEKVKLMLDHVVPYDSSNYMTAAYYPTRIRYNEVSDGVPPNKVVYYFAGSGSTTHIEGSLPDAIVEAGYVFVSTLPARILTTEDLMWINGYGNVNSPNFLGYVAMDGWMVKNAINQVMPLSSKVILAQSKGATGAVGYLAGLCNDTDFSNNRLEGAYLNGASLASLSDKAWVNIEGTIRIMGDIINWSSKSNIPRILHYGERDTFMTPNMLDKVQLMQPKGKKDPNIYYASTDNLHSWMNKSKENADYVTKQVSKIFRGEYR